MWKNKKKRNASVFLWLAGVSGKEKWKIAELLFLQSLLGISSVGYAVLLREIIDSAVRKEQGLFWQNAALLVGLIVFQIVCRAAVRWLEEAARATMENRLKNRLFRHLLNGEFAAVNAIHSGEWMNRLTSDSVVVADGMVQILPGAVGMLVKMIGALGMILLLEPIFGLLIVPGGCLMLLLSYCFRKYMKTLHKKIQEMDGRLRVFLQEYLGSLLIVRSFAVEDQVLQEAQERMEAHRTARMNRTRFSVFCNIGFSGLMQGAYVLGAVFCSYGIMTGTITYGTLTAVLQLISQVQNPVANITGYLPKYYGMLASAERLMEAEQFLESHREPALELSQIRKYYEQSFAAFGLENASFSYRKAELQSVRPLDGEESGFIQEKEAQISEEYSEVLKKVCLEIRKGDYTAFTGSSGSGKSTLLKILLCLYPLDEGKRYLKEMDGTQRELTEAWHKMFAYVPQGNYLMNGTIREMIAFGDREAMWEEERMQSALRIACAQEFVLSLEQGLDTLLGERGQGLSEGQMQRIAIARAIFSGHPVLLLDEATSALDEETEARVLSNLKAMTDKTVLIVTHRPAALKICNRQIVITGDAVRMETMVRTEERIETEERK